MNYYKFLWLIPLALIVFLYFAPMNYYCWIVGEDGGKTSYQEAAKINSAISRLMHAYVTMEGQCYKFTGYAFVVLGVAAITLFMRRNDLQTMFKKK